jgi:hypothetical protein
VGQAFRKYRSAIRFLLSPDRAGQVRKEINTFCFGQECRCQTCLTFPTILIIRNCFLVLTRIDTAATKAIAAADRGSGTISRQKGMPLDGSDDDESESSSVVDPQDDIYYEDADEVMMLAEDLAEGMLMMRSAPTAAQSSSSAASKESDAAGDTSSGDAPSSHPAIPSNPTTTGFDTLMLEEKLRRRARVLTRSELILLLTDLPVRLHLAAQPRHQGRICVGMLGYPNVGKSSAINTILAVSKSSHGKNN